MKGVKDKHSLEGTWSQILKALFVSSVIPWVGWEVECWTWWVAVLLNLCLLGFVLAWGWSKRATKLPTDYYDWIKKDP